MTKKTFERNGKMFRICSKCKQDKLLCRDNFYFSNKDNYGFNYRCVKCLLRPKKPRFQTCKVCKTKKPLESFELITYITSANGKQRSVGKSSCKECSRLAKKTYERDGQQFRICNYCKIEYPLSLDNFYKDSSKSYGYSYRCKTCCGKIINGSKEQELSRRIKISLRSRLSRVLRLHRDCKKISNTIELTGCEAKMLMSHIESQFKDGMSWSNYGYDGWHIDHIIPCASFNLTDPEQQKKCFHYTNLQPLWAKDNFKKGTKLTGV